MGPQEFNFIFFLFIFIIGLDYIWSGYLTIANKTHEKRRLLGLWVIQRFHIPESKKKNFNGYMNFIYDLRNMGFMVFAGGVLITLGSALMIFNFLL